MHPPIFRWLLADHGIRRFEDEGWLSFGRQLATNQRQPTTVDLTLAGIRRFTAKPGIDVLVSPDDMQEIISFDDELELPPYSYAEALFQESITHGTQVGEVSVELRSSRGRLHVRPNLTNLKHLQADDEYTYLEVFNESPATVLMKRGSKFAQVFIHPRDGQHADGYVVNNANEVRDLLPDLAHLVTPEGYVRFCVGSKVMRLKESVSRIDTSEDNHDLYDVVDSSGALISPSRPALAVLEPEVNLPSHVGLRFLTGIPYSQSSPRLNHTILSLDNFAVLAGWGDPGYQGKLTGHISRTLQQLKLEHGMPIAYAQVYHFTTPPTSLYGEKHLDSHYQGSQGAISKS